MKLIIEKTNGEQNWSGLDAGAQMSYFRYNLCFKHSFISNCRFNPFASAFSKSTMTNSNFLSCWHRMLYCLACCQAPEQQERTAVAFHTVLQHLANMKGLVSVNVSKNIRSICELFHLKRSNQKCIPTTALELIMRIIHLVHTHYFIYSLSVKKSAIITIAFPADWTPLCKVFPRASLLSLRTLYLLQRYFSPQGYMTCQDLTIGLLLCCGYFFLRKFEYLPYCSSYFVCCLFRVAVFSNRADSSPSVVFDRPYCTNCTGHFRVTFSDFFIIMCGTPVHFLSFGDEISV